MENEYRVKLYKIGILFLAVLTIHFAVSIFRGDYHHKGDQAPSTITLSGHGEVNAVPDIASIYFNVESSKTTQSEASNEVNTKTKKVLDLLKSSGVDEKDIKTENYSSNPTYSNSTPCPMIYSPNGILPPCRMETPKITGYSVSESITVKVRKVDDASKIIDGINKIGVSNMSGPNLTIDDQDTLKAQARKEAIDDAKEKAKSLAKDLDVRLGEIQSFSESGNYPVYYQKAAFSSADSGVAPVPAELPKGQTTITSDVSITYEIK